MEQVQPGVDWPAAVGGVVAAEVRIPRFVPDRRLGALAQYPRKPESAAARLLGVEERRAERSGHDHVVPRRSLHLELVHGRQLPVDAVVRVGQAAHAVHAITFARLVRPQVVVHPETTVDVEDGQEVTDVQTAERW